MSPEIIALKDVKNPELTRSAALAQQIRLLCAKGGYPRTDPVADLFRCLLYDSLIGSLR